MEVIRVLFEMMDKQISVIAFGIFFIVLCVVYFVGRKKDVTDAGQSQFNSLITFYLISIVLIAISITGYYELSKNYSENDIISSGLILPLWLVITGLLIRGIYNFTRFIVKNKFTDLTNEDKKSILLASSLLFSLAMLSIDLKLFYVVLAIIIGKFLWMDTSYDIFDKIIDEFRDVSSLCWKTLAMNAMIFILGFYSKDFLGGPITLGIFVGLLSAIILVVIWVIIILLLGRNNKR